MPSINDTISIYFFGDIHRFVKSCDVEEWKRFLREAKRDVERRPDQVFFAGLGDYDDFASTREKQDLAKLHETTIDSLDEMNERRTRVLASEMKIMKGRTLGLIEGNHHWVYQDGTTTTMDLADRLETDYLGWLSHLTLQIRIGRGSGRMATVHLVLNHGRAGGKRAGAGINQVEDLKDVFPDADILVMGHNHQRGSWPHNRLVPYQKKDGSYHLKPKRQLLCRSGSFKRAYGNGESEVKGYEISRLLKPADLGAIRVDIAFRREIKGQNDRLITDLTAVA